MSRSRQDAPAAAMIPRFVSGFPIVASREPIRMSAA